MTSSASPYLSHTNSNPVSPTPLRLGLSSWITTFQRMSPIIIQITRGSSGRTPSAEISGKISENLQETIPPAGFVKR
jgi:hypothetical protein